MAEMMERFNAHSLEGRPLDEWHRLEEHLKGTAELAAQFAAEFGCREWGYIAGLWHDLGKYSEDFQKKIHAVAAGGTVMGFLMSGRPLARRP